MSVGMHQLNICRPWHPGYNHLRSQIIQIIYQPFGLAPKILIDAAAFNQEIVLVFGNDFLQYLKIVLRIRK